MMIWEGDIAPFAKALIAAQMASEVIKKTSVNPGFKSNYADLAAVVEAVIPAMNANGIAVLQSPSFDGEYLSVTTTFLHDSGARVTSTFALRPSKSDPQGLGSATTYARRYSLLAMTGTAPEDDDANAASAGGGYQDPAPTRQAPARAPLNVTPARPAIANKATPFDDHPKDPTPFERASQEIALCVELDELGAMWTRNAAGWREFFSTAVFDKLTAAKNNRKADLTALAAA